jgi:hypothetical protein
VVLSLLIELCVNAFCVLLQLFRSDPETLLSKRILSEYGHHYKHFQKSVVPKTDKDGSKMDIAIRFRRPY